MRATDSAAATAETAAAPTDRAATGTSSPTPPEGATMARSVIRGTVVGFFVVAGITGGASLAMGSGLAGALAVAGFTGLWGGPGFGGMMGFVLHQSREDHSGS